MQDLAAVTARALQLELAIRGAVRSGLISDGEFAEVLEDLSSEVVDGLKQAVQSK